MWNVADIRENILAWLKRNLICRFRGHNWTQTYRHLEDLDPLFLCKRCFEETR